MKKVYLSALAIALGVSGVNAQTFVEKNTAMKQFPGDAKIAKTKALGTPVWTNDFSNASDWTIDNDGQSGATFGWNIDATADSWYFTGGISSTSGGGFAEVNNGDATQGNQVLDVTYTMTTAQAIDVQTLAGSNLVNLSFEQYGALFNDLQEVQVSTDGTNFTTVYDNLDKEVLSQAGGAPYADPEEVVVPIGDVIAGGASTVYIRFSWTTNYPNSATNPNVWITYGWMIDDVAISTLPDYDIAITSTVWGSLVNELQYYRIPTAQVQPIKFSANVKNQGGTDMTNVAVDLDVNGSVTNGTAVNITANTEDSIAVEYTPAGADSYTLAASIVSTEVDDIPGNNVLPMVPADIVVEDVPATPGSIAYEGYIYQRDAGSNYGENGGTTTIGGTEVTGYEAGTYYEINTDATLHALDIGIADNSDNVGTEVYAAIYSYGANGFQIEGTSDFHTVTNDDLGKIRIMNLTAPVNLTAGTLYFAAIGTQDDFTYMSSGTSYQGLSLIFYGGGMLAPVTNGNFYTTATPVVRMNFLGNVATEGVDALEASLGQNAPNPFSTTTDITFELTEANNVSFEIRDLSGKLVQSANLNTLNAGTHTYTVDASNLAGGVYTYTMTVGGNSVTKKMVVKK